MINKGYYVVSFAVLGGILLNIGAFLTYKGQIFKAVLVYIVADLCWVIMAYRNDDYLGTFFIVVGMTLGLLAYIKMNSGKMSKELHVGEKDDI